MKCPFNHFEPCDPECVLYRRGMRYYEDKRKPEPVEMCAINYMVDCLENLVERSIGHQASLDKQVNTSVMLGEIIAAAASGRVRKVGRGN